jgi:hypothetical protein
MICLEEETHVMFVWAQMDGPEVELVDATNSDSSFVPPEPGMYKFKCTATYPKTDIHNRVEESVPDTVRIGVYP